MSWNSVENKPSKNGIYKVKDSSEDIQEAYYYMDGGSWQSFYGIKTTPWHSRKTGEHLYNVTHWQERIVD